MRTLTSIGERGHAAVDRYAGQAFDERMNRIDRMLNHYLKTGAMLRDP
jgi:hypothetical protein